MRRFNVIKKGWGTSETVAMNMPWPKAWRLAAKGNDRVREAFREGRIMYDVPEYLVEEVST
jgi:hypothetical protein